MKFYCAILWLLRTPSNRTKSSSHVYVRVFLVLHHFIAAFGFSEHVISRDCWFFKPQYLLSFNTWINPLSIKFQKSWVVSWDYKQTTAWIVMIRYVWLLNMTYTDLKRDYYVLGWCQVELLFKFSISESNLSKLLFKF